MAQQEDRPNVVLISLVAGLIGAGLGLLLAPRSGRETREKLQSKTNDVKQQAQQNLAQLRNQARETKRYAYDMKNKITGAIKTQDKQTQHDESQEDTPPRRQSSVLTSWDEEV